MGIFLLQFLMKFADHLVGKGLPAFVIAKLIVYNLAWMLVLVLPMAVLVATLMAFGNMAQNNEVAIMKSTGMSLIKMMYAPLIGGILLALFLIWFNNNVYPNANHAARMIMYDISRKKPTVSLVEGVISNEIPGYSILAQKIDQKSNEMEDLKIFDRSDYNKSIVITARKGKIYFSNDKTKMILDLHDGEIHETSFAKGGTYRKILFKHHKIALPSDQFTFKETSDIQRGDRELGAPAMVKIVDSLRVIREKKFADLAKKIELTFPSMPHKKKIVKRRHKSEREVLSAVTDRLNLDRSRLRSDLTRLEHNRRSINKYEVEIHKKYALPFACLVFVLIGVPLGTMLRKGGFGVASGVSLLFFLIYWAFLIGGEKLADRGLFSPFWGIWSANFFLGILGIYLTYVSSKERIELDFSFLLKLFKRKNENA
jgi:lipopolysaccharide export system permease protein